MFNYFSKEIACKKKRVNIALFDCCLINIGFLEDAIEMLKVIFNEEVAQFVAQINEYSKRMIFL